MLWMARTGQLDAVKEILKTSKDPDIKIYNPPEIDEIFVYRDYEIGIFYKGKFIRIHPRIVSINNKKFENILKEIAKNPSQYSCSKDLKLIKRAYKKEIRRFERLPLETQKWIIRKFT